ncbi:hypothetical protein M6B38_115760 [Iris pallida]|uniref:Uncharacterized protein n=1 Tax=Iris pallida TaxID=29817 RepID=A0AAX6I3V8_IRIPA|nr:hypothetical protein M6B38_115760 [Iris pallida]
MVIGAVGGESADGGRVRVRIRVRRGLFVCVTVGDEVSRCVRHGMENCICNKMEGNLVGGAL